MDVQDDVPTYSNLIGGKVNHIFINLPNQKIFQRFNWSIYESPDLYQPAINKRSIKRAKDIQR